MEFINLTPFSAALFRTCIDDNRLAASVLAKITYKIVDSKLVIAEEQPWKVSATPQISEYGQIPADHVLRRGGVDIFIFGQVYTQRLAQYQEVSVQTNLLKRNTIVFGNRVWKSQRGQLVASAPVPFKSMPLSLERAYGGSISWDGLTIPHTDNPTGCGYYDTEAAALDQPLPNIEEADQLIKAWNDRPLPAGFTFCPLQSGIRLRNSITMNSVGIPEAIHPLIFNDAFPRMVAPAVRPQERLRLTGLTPEGYLEFATPKQHLFARVQFSDELDEQPLMIEQVGIDAEKKKVYITYRFHFRYVVIAGQQRLVELKSIPL